MKSALPKTASFHSKHSFIAARFFRRRAQHKLGNTSEISEATLQYPPPLPILIALKMHTTSSHYGVFSGQSTKYLKSTKNQYQQKIAQSTYRQSS